MQRNICTEHDIHVAEQAKLPKLKKQRILQVRKHLQNKLFLSSTVSIK